MLLYCLFCAVALYSLEMQVAAGKLKNVTRTKVVALGIGNAVTQSELRNIASTPHVSNVIRVHNFSSLGNMTSHLRDATCSGWLAKCNVTVEIM